VDDFAEFRHFRYLLAVAQHKGFRAAAEALNTAQPSLSRQIKEFQEYYNLRLFIPGKGKRVELTVAGEALEVIATEVLEVKDDALAALEAIQRGEAQVLRIGCTPFVDKGICKRATDLQKVLIPSASVRMSTGDRLCPRSAVCPERLSPAAGRHQSALSDAAGGAADRREGPGARLRRSILLESRVQPPAGPAAGPNCSG